MKVRVIYDSKIPRLLSVFINIGAITLFPYIIYRYKEEDVSKVTVNHEMIHIAQQRELWVIGFYLLYVLFWLYNVCKYWDTKLAYYNIPFEVEAYLNQENKVYILNRKKHSWLYYIGKELPVD